MNAEAVRWALYPCRTPYAVEVAEIIWRRGEEVALLVDNLAEAEEGSEGARIDPATEIGARVIRPDQLPAAAAGLAIAVPPITPGHRSALEAEVRAHGLSAFPPLLDPSAIVARSAEVGEGSILNAATVVGAGSTLGRFVHVNRSASIGHHGLVEDYATVGPACALAGHVHIGRGAFIGAGAVCAPKVSVGANAVVGAGAVVVEDLPAGVVAVGNPSRVIREGQPGYGGVSVPG